MKKNAFYNKINNKNTTHIHYIKKKKQSCEKIHKDFSLSCIEALYRQMFTF